MESNAAKRIVLAILCVIQLLMSHYSVKAQSRFPIVSLGGEVQSFAQEAHTLDLFVVPLLGADCMFLRSGEKWMMIDMGKESNIEQIIQVIGDLGIKRLDLAFNTHPHSDHIGGLRQMLDVIEIDRFVTVFPQDYTGPSVRQISTLGTLKKAGIPIEEMRDGSSFSLEEATFLVMKTDAADTNQASAMLHVRFGSTTLLLAADVNRLGQNALALKYDMKADILKYPHHGLERLDESFMRNVDPDFSFFTHGYVNTGEGQRWLAKFDVPFRFATWGVIHLSSNGERWILRQDIIEEAKGYKAYKDMNWN